MVKNYLKNIFLKCVENINIFKIYWKSQNCENLKIVKISKLWTSQNCENLKIVKISKLWTSQNCENLKIVKYYFQNSE